MLPAVRQPAGSTVIRASLPCLRRRQRLRYRRTPPLLFQQFPGGSAEPALQGGTAQVSKLTAMGFHPRLGSCHPHRIQ